MSRRPGLLVAFAIIALISAGCSKAPAETGTDSNSSGGVVSAAGPGTNTTANREQAVQFAQCMRNNGVKEFPDPDASGALTIDQVVNGSSLDQNTAEWKRAIGACKDLQPQGFTGQKRSPELQKAALKFAECIRDNGVKDFPDPDPNGPLIDTNRIPSAAGSSGRSILRGAMQKCRGLAAAAGVTGAK